MEDQIKIPKGEIVWERIYFGGKLCYVITSKSARDYYYIYRNESGCLKKLGKAKTPTELHEKYEKY